jgi:hypothetical protein
VIGLVVNCARAECGKEFHKTTHNQKYCTNECCRIETNRKIMEKYHERAAIKRGKKRSCKSCGISLSRYNEGKICGACETRKREAHVGEAAALVGSVSWL